MVARPAKPMPSRAREAGSGTEPPTEPFGTEAKRRVPPATRNSPKPSPKNVTFEKKPDESMAPMKLVKLCAAA